MIDSLYAKSARHGRNPEPLTRHLIAALEAAKLIRNRVGDLTAGHLVPGGLWPAVECAALCHDLGKLADGFQNMVTGRTRGWGQRHEMLSLGFLPDAIPDINERLWIASAIITHHRPLTTTPIATEGDSIASRYAGCDFNDLLTCFGPISDTAIAALRQWLSTHLTTNPTTHLTALDSPPLSVTDLVALAVEVFDQVYEHWQTPVSQETGLAAVLCQGALTMADHLSSAYSATEKNVIHTHQPIDDTFPDTLATYLADIHHVHQFHNHQHRCRDINGHLLLRSPTGSGKTEAGLLWASSQVTALKATTGGTPRIFLTLPYLASINAMVQRLGDLLGDHTLIGVSHSRAASYHLAHAIGEDDSHTASRKAISRATATRLFRETIRVATPYQLLRAALAGPTHSSILVDLANSVIILDELHAYDTRRLGYILASAQLWQRLGCRIAVLSATLPAALADLVSETLNEQVTTVVGPPGQPRHRLHLRDHTLTDETCIADIAASLKADKSVLVVANNVAQAQNIFDILAPDVHNRHGDQAAVMLHSRFRRIDREAIEKTLTHRYGPHTDQRLPGLIVATQVVEVSLDIDLDILYTTGAPLEALLQRFGRINRRGTRPPADVIVCQPHYAPRRGDPLGPPYADGIYEAEPVTLGMSILSRHQGQTIDETEATGWLNEIYNSTWGHHWRAEVTHRRNEFAKLFLGFESPFHSRDTLEETFDQLFEGTEAILSEDKDKYEADLGSRGSAADRILAERYLIPLPYWATGIVSYDKRLRVRIIDGDYDPKRGLLAIRPRRNTATYEPGEVL